MSEGLHIKSYLIALHLAITDYYGDMGSLSPEVTAVPKSNGPGFKMNKAVTTLDVA